MPVSNIIDRRTNKYNVNCLVIFEESWHNNSIEGATQFNDDTEHVLYLCVKSTTIQKAIKYINKNYEHDITIFLYDVNDNEHPCYLTIDDDLNLVKF